MKLTAGRHRAAAGAPCPLADLAALIGADAPLLPERAPAIVVASGGRRVAAWCDPLLGQENRRETARPSLHRWHGYLGGAILGDGGSHLLLDPAAAHAREAQHAQAGGRRSQSRTSACRRRCSSSRTLTGPRDCSDSLERAGYRVETRRDGGYSVQLADGVGVLDDEHLRRHADVRL